jgi:hypothetical protein
LGPVDTSPLPLNLLGAYPHKLPVCDISYSETVFDYF